jgi:hypothetical protein
MSDELTDLRDRIERLIEDWTAMPELVPPVCVWALAALLHPEDDA